MRRLLLTGVSFLALGLAPAAFAQAQGGSDTPMAQPGAAGQGGVAAPQLDETYRSYSELVRTVPGGVVGTGAAGTGAPGTGGTTGAGAVGTDALGPGGATGAGAVGTGALGTGGVTSAGAVGTGAAGTGAANIGGATGTGAAGTGPGVNVTGTLPGGITPDQALGQDVYGPNGQDVAEIEDVLIDDGGKVAAVILDVGGFLGLGERQVAVPLNMLRPTTDAGAPGSAGAPGGAGAAGGGGDAANTGPAGAGVGTATGAGGNMAPGAGAAGVGTLGDAGDALTVGGAGTGPGGAAAPGAGVAGAGTSGDALTSAGPGTAAGGPRLAIDMTEDQLKQLPEYRQGGNMWVRQAPQ